MAALGNPVAGEAGRARDLPVRAAALWHGLNTSRVPPLLWLVALWFVLVVPLIFLRAAHFEDGTGIARTAIGSFRISMGIASMSAPFCCHSSSR
jgi:hypothetical protein